MACMPSRSTGGMTREDFGPQDGDSGNGKSGAERCSGDTENERGVKLYSHVCVGKLGTLVCYILGVIQCSFIRTIWSREYTELSFGDLEFELPERCSTGYVNWPGETWVGDDNQATAEWETL